MSRMKAIINNTTRYLAWSALFLVMLILLALAGLYGSVLWLNSEQGNQWLVSQLNNKLSPAAHRISLNKFSIEGLFRLHSDQIALHNADGSLITADKVNLSIALANITSLEVNLDIETLDVMSLPVTKHKTLKKDNTQLVLPDLYLNSFDLDIAVEKIVLSEQIIESGFEAGLNIKQNISVLGQSIEVRGNSKLLKVAYEKAELIPQMLSTDLVFDASRQAITINEIVASNEVYSTNIKGKYLATERTFDGEANASLYQPELFIDGHDETIDINTSITGSIDQFSSDITITTRYQDAAANVSTRLGRDKTLINLDKLSIQTAPLKLIGRLSYDLDKQGIIGEVDALISESEQNMAAVEDFAFSVSSLKEDTLNIEVDAKRVDLLSFPQTQQPSQDNTETTNPLLGLPFNSANLRANIDSLVIADPLIEGGLETSLKIEQHVNIDDNIISLAGDHALQNTQHAQALYIPGSVKHKATFDFPSQILAIDTISLDNDSYSFDINGSYGIKDESFDIQIGGQWLNPQLISDDLQFPLTLNTSVTGNLEKFIADTIIATQYRDTETVLEAQIERNSALIKATGLRGQGGLLNLEGEIEYDINSTLLDGKINADLADIGFVNQFIDVPTLAGQATASIQVFNDAGQQAATAIIGVKNAKYQDLSIDAISANLDVSDLYNYKNLHAKLNLKNALINDIKLKQATFNVFPANSGYQFSFNGECGNIEPCLATVDAELHDIQSLDVSISKGTLNIGEGEININGSIQPDSLDVVARAKAVNLEQLQFLGVPTLPIIIDELTVNTVGSLANPNVQANYLFRPTQQPLEASFKGESIYREDKLVSSLSGTGIGINEFKVDASIPLQFSLQPVNFELNKANAISGQASIVSDIKPLSTILLDEGYRVDGDLSVNAQIAGALGAPRLLGEIKIDGGSFTDAYSDIQLVNISGLAKFEDRAIQIIKVSAQDATQTGSVLITGKLDLEDFSKPDINAELSMQGMQILQNENYDVWLNAAMRVDTQQEGYLISGELSPEEVSIRIPDQFNETIPEVNIVESEQPQNPANDLLAKTKLDLKFKADNKIFVSGWGLNAELQGNLDIKGDLREPLVNGNLRTLRGRYEEFGRRFDIDKAVLRFQGTIPQSPYLDISASSEIEGHTASILITDMVSAPSIKLASVPAKPEDEILALILFGRSTSQISPFQAVQLANTLRRFSGRGGSGFDPLQRIQSATGLDDIRIESDGSDSVTIGAGKYISDQVYVEIEQGTAENSGTASIEFELTPRISLESKTTQNNESDIGVFWQWDY